ncbi:MAG: hypothetical protein M3Q86_01390 [Verrucomicrobiota bacterium]|nr:hypothetical protein [Verrucomicrobiota bacterium]
MADSALSLGAGRRRGFIASRILPIVIKSDAIPIPIEDFESRIHQRAGHIRVHQAGPDGADEDLAIVGSRAGDKAANQDAAIATSIIVNQSSD